MAPQSKSCAPIPSNRLRQSCDRCHGQKLRCIREEGSGDGNACNRCIRQGAECVYSMSMHKGRPSIYRLAQASAAKASAQPATSSKHSTAGSSTAASSATSVSDKASGSTTTNDDDDDDEHATDEKDVGASNAEDMSWDNLMDTSMSDLIWPWLAPSEDTQMQMDGIDEDFSQWFVKGSDNGGGYQQDAMADLFPLPVTGLPDWDTTATTLTSDHNVTPQTHHPSVGSQPPKSSMSSTGSGRASSGSNSGTSSMDPDSAHWSSAIARLSQLNLRLCALHRTSSTLATPTARASESPLIDDAALRSVVGWLSHVSADASLLLQSPGTQQDSTKFATVTIGTTLRDTFSASHHLLEILRDIQADVSNITSTLDTSWMKLMPNLLDGAASLDLWNTPDQQSPQTILPNSAHTFPQHFDASSLHRSRSASNPMSNTVVDQLIIACHTLLLNIFVAVLMAVQHDADRWNPATPLADIRPVMTAQVCSYLIERQNQAVDLYLASSNHSPDYAWSDQPQHPPLVASPSSTMASREELTYLRGDIERRLVRLRQSLRF